MIDLPPLHSTMGRNLDTFLGDRAESWPSSTENSNAWIAGQTSYSAQVNRAFFTKTTLLMNPSGASRVSGDVREGRSSEPRHALHAPVAELRHPSHSNPHRERRFCAGHVFRRRGSNTSSAQSGSGEPQVGQVARGRPQTADTGLVRRTRDTRLLWTEMGIP